MHALGLHPHCAAGSVRHVEASVAATPAGCRAEFVARGDISAIRVPAIAADSGRHDDLWRTTCFEIFWQPQGERCYREFNLSPSTHWACYDFDDFRQGMRNAPAEIEIAMTISADELRVVAHVRAALVTPARVALNAIIDDADGVNRYWALAFPDGAPEFHSAQCRALAV